MFSYCKSLDNLSMKQDHVTLRSASNERKTERLSIIGKKTDMLVTHTPIKSEVIKRITNFYNTSTKHQARLPSGIKHQQVIGFGHLCKGRISITLTCEMSYYYQLENN